MSKYVNKQTLLKWLEQRYKENNEEFEVDRSGEDMEIINEIKSGAFDVDQTEVQVLRAALHKITQIFDDPDLHDLTACQEMNRVAKEALSTTIEPTNATTKVTNNG